MSTSTNTAGRVTVRVEDLPRLLKAVALFAGTDDTLPVLKHVKLDVHNGQVRACATDRFRAACSYVEQAPDTDSIGNVTALISADAVKSLLTVFKPERGQPNKPVEITVETNPSGDDSTIRFREPWSGLETVMRSHNLDFPRLDSIFATALAETPTRTVQAFNPAMLADYKAVASILKTQTVTLYSAKRETSGALFVFDEHFLVVHMLRRTPMPAGEELRTWAARYGVTASEKAAS